MQMKKSRLGHTECGLSPEYQVQMSSEQLALWIWSSGGSLGEGSIYGSVHRYGQKQEFKLILQRKSQELRRAFTLYRKTSSPDSPIAVQKIFLFTKKIFQLNSYDCPNAAIAHISYSKYIFLHSWARLNFSRAGTRPYLYYLYHQHKFWYTDCSKSMFTELIPQASGSIIILFLILCLNHNCF